MAPRPTVANDEKPSPQAKSPLLSLRLTPIQFSEIFVSRLVNTAACLPNPFVARLKLNSAKILLLAFF